MYHDKYNLFTRTLKAENGTLSLLLDQPFVGAFKSAVTNCFNLLHWLIHHFIILFIYLFIYYYYYILLLLLLFFLFCTFTVMGKNRKALYRLSQSCCGTFLTPKCHFWAGCKSFRISIELSYFTCPKPLRCIKYLLSFCKKPNKSIASLKYCYCFLLIFCRSHNFDFPFFDLKIA